MRSLQAWQSGADGDEVVSVQTSVARHEEGLRSAIEGAFYGGFSDNDSYSGIAGQTAVGFIPIVGQIADARDIATAARDVYNGKDGALPQLLIAGVAVVPGLDFLKGGSKVGRKVLGEVAEEVGERVVKEGVATAEQGALRATERVATRGGERGGWCRRQRRWAQVSLGCIEKLSVRAELLCFLWLKNQLPEH